MNATPRPCSKLWSRSNRTGAGIPYRHRRRPLHDRRSERFGQSLKIRSGGRARPQRHEGTGRQGAGRGQESLRDLAIRQRGKSRAEAEADTCEAIDFMEFYARQALSYDAPQPLTPSPLPFEVNEMKYIPLGVGVVIPPWNFPLAIMAGMATAALVAGNTVIIKPSHDSPVIAAKFMELMEEISLPPGVLNFLPGQGSAVGEYMVAHPKTRFIAFTGSMAVGLRINELAAKPRDGQVWIKRVVAEMGGKDTIVVDETANLDEAAAGIVASAFGYSGQKCSACSRAVIVSSVYDQVVAKVAERVS